MMTALFLAMSQIGDPAFRAPLFRAAALALAGIAGLVWLAAWSVGELAGGTGWLAGLAAAAGGLLVAAAAFWLFVPLMLAIAGLFLDGVAAAVEQRHYPALPPPQGAGLAAQGWAAITMAMKLGAITLVLLPLALLVPLVGAPLLWIVAAIGLGEGLFEGVAQRRMDAGAARALTRARRVPVWGLGAVLALLGLVPLLNLLVPVIGTAAMTHLFHRAGSGG